ncbi:MAG TPA: EAL domain-containing protein [Desulfobacterales bacterium]|nr:EAL domain-containing protein [Desulfobacterales bacterium]
MTKTKHQITLLDKTGILIVGIGACLFYYYFETTLSGGNLNILITVGIILVISLFTQYLVNDINSSKGALQQANETLEHRVRERTWELRNSELKYRTIFENTGAATIIIEKDKKISLANSRFLDMSGCSRSEILNRKTWLDFIDEKSYRKLSGDEKSPAAEMPTVHGKHVECQFVDKHENRKDILISFAQIPETEASVASLTDITELKDAERLIYFQAFHDALTRLPNRALFLEHLSMAIKRAKRRPDYHFAVIYLDIDRFKLVNDSLGHTAGDDLLVAFAGRVREFLREIDTLARLGGDEFVILLEDVSDPNYANSIVERLQQALSKPFALQNKEVFAPASFGVVLNPQDYEQPEMVIRDADAAMYHAKESGRGQVKVFDRNLHEKTIHLLQQETDLRKAVNKNQFQNHYQPIVRLDTACVVGFEALIRWNHPETGMIYPGAFIPTAEENGLIIPITRLTVERSCRDLQDWQKVLGTSLEFTVSVNISSRHFLQPSLLDDLKEVLDETGLPPHLLKLEITETALMDKADESIRMAHRLREFGIRLMIDDFGTGYSSLSYLQRLPIDTLKIDRSFISKIHENPQSNRNIVEAIVSLAHKLDMHVVAEGIETPEQHAILLDMKCEFGQGYLFSRPMPKLDVDALVSRMVSFSPSERQRYYSLTAGLPN